MHGMSAEQSAHLSRPRITHRRQHLESDPSLLQLVQVWASTIKDDE